MKTYSSWENLTLNNVNDFLDDYNKSLKRYETYANFNVCVKSFDKEMVQLVIKFKGIAIDSIYITTNQTIFEVTVKLEDIIRAMHSTIYAISNIILAP